MSVNQTVKSLSELLECFLLLLHAIFKCLKEKKTYLKPYDFKDKKSHLCENKHSGKHD